jgi:hypothetical protein
MKINEVVYEGLGTGLLKLGAKVSQYFDPALADKLDRALIDAKLAAPSEQLNRLTGDLAKQAKNNQNRISKLEIYKNTKDILGNIYNTPQSRISATKSVIQSLQRQGILITDQPAPTRVYAPNPKYAAKSTSVEQPYYLGGKQLNPNDPNDRAIIDKLKAQQGAV